MSATRPGRRKVSAHQAARNYVRALQGQLAAIRDHVEAMPKPDTKSGAPVYATAQVAEWANRLRELTGVNLGRVPTY